MCQQGHWLYLIGNGEERWRAARCKLKLRQNDRTGWRGDPPTLLILRRFHIHTGAVFGKPRTGRWSTPDANTRMRQNIAKSIQPPQTHVSETAESESGWRLRRHLALLVIFSCNSCPQDDISMRGALRNFSIFFTHLGQHRA